MASEHEKYAYQIGLMPDEFWSMIPAEFIKLYKNRIKSIEDAEEREWLKFAQLQATIVNVNRTKKGKTYKAKDFMPRKREKKSAEQMYKTVERLNALLGGTRKGVEK